MIKASAVLRRAAEILAQRGWRQGKESEAACDDPGHVGPVCVGVAMRLASWEFLGWQVEDYSLNRRLRRALMAAVEVKRDSERALCGWNDKPSRTAGQARKALIRAAAIAEGKEAKSPCSPP